MYQVLLFKSRRHLCKGSMAIADALYTTISATLHNRQPIHWTIRFILHVSAEHQCTIMQKHIYTKPLLSQKSPSLHTTTRHT